MTNLPKIGFKFISLLNNNIYEITAYSTHEMFCTVNYYNRGLKTWVRDGGGIEVSVLLRNLKNGEWVEATPAAMVLFGVNIDETE